jgi:TolB-like protein/Flp pilus assembly protein TadD
MKCCPACKRIENDDALVFCRADGTPLVSDSGSVSTEIGTVKFGSAPVASEIKTSVLPQHTTDAGVNRATGPTTVLDRQHTISTTRALGRPKRTKAIVFVGAAILMIAVAIAVSVYFFVSRRNNAAIESIAVLPFVNESGNADVEYLSDGMTESLISSLSQIPKLNVKARSSVFRYKGKDTNAQTIGKELNVQAILNGRVVQHGQDLTLYVELVEAATENVLWKQTYNKTMTNLVALQNDIARDVADRLRVKLSGADEQKLAKHYTDNPEAYQLYLKGRFYWNQRTGEALKKSIEYFNQAIEKDSSYALAYAGLGDAYSLLPGYGGASPRESFPKAEAAARRAVELDDTLAEAHTSLAQVLIQEWNLPDSDREIQRAIVLNPNYPTAHHWYGCNNLLVTGRFDEAIAEGKRAQELDPLSLIINADLGYDYIYARRYDQAIEQLRKTIEMDQSFYYAHRLLGQAYDLKGSFPEALAEYQKAGQLSDDPLVLAFLGHAYAASGQRDEALQTLNQLAEIAGHRYVSAYSVAMVYAELGEKDQALNWLEKGYQERATKMVFLKIDPFFDNLRSDPRFVELVRRVGLPQ